MKYGLGYTLVTRITGFIARTVLYYRRTELNFICDLLKNKKNIKVLDYGCNTGYLLDIIKSKYPSNNLNLYGADINPYALKYAKKKHKDCTFYDIDACLLEKGKFDVIILSHVLEHIKERDIFVTNLKKLLKKDGELIIAVPQERIRGDCTVIQLLYNFLRFRFENPHVVKINYADLNILLKKQNMDIQQHIYTHFFYPFKSNTLRADSWSLVALCKNR